MVICRYREVFLCAINALLLAGCASNSADTTDSSAVAHHAAWEPPLISSSKSKPEKVPEVDPKRVEAYAHYIAGMIADLDQKPDQALDELSQAATLDPSNADLVLELTRRYMRQRQPEKALELLQRATALPGASGALLAQLGLVYSHLGKDELAIAACQNAIKASPDMLDGYRVLFFIQTQHGRPAEARKALEQALNVPNTTPEFVVDAVDLCGILERQAPSQKNAITNKAVAALNRVAAENPSDPHLRIRMADDYNQLGDSKAAAKIYLQLLAAYGELPALRGDIHEKLARIYLQQEDYTNATTQLEAIVQDDPANGQAYTLLGSLFEEQKKLPDAEEYYRKALILDDTQFNSYYDLARIQVLLDHPSDAIVTIDRARHKFSDNFKLEMLSAEAYDQQKDYTNAVNRFTTAEVIAKATNPKLLNDEFYFFQGAACERAGDIAQAEKCFEKSLDIKPDAPETLNYLGYMWADHDMKLDKALDLIQKAVKIEPKSPAYLDSLAWVLYKLNRPAEALPNMQKAIELSPTADATLFEHLGDIFAKLKQPDKAREAYTKSLGVESNEQIRKKLDNLKTKTGPEIN